MFRARPVFQQGYLDYFFLFIRNELETIDEDDTLELGSLPNFRSGIDVKLPQRLLFDTRAIYFFFLFFLFFANFLPRNSLFPSLFPSLPFTGRENVKNHNHTCFHPASLFFFRSNELRRVVRFLFLFFIFLFFLRFTGAKLVVLAPSGSRHEN